MHYLLVWTLVLACRAIGLADQVVVSVLSASGAMALCWWLDGLTQRTGIAPYLGFGLRR